MTLYKAIVIPVVIVVYRTQYKNTCLISLYKFFTKLKGDVFLAFQH